MQEDLVKISKKNIVHTIFFIFLLMDALMPFLDQIFAPLSVDQKWYPVIIIGVVFLLLMIIYIFFAFIRTFLGWLWRVDDTIHTQKETQEMLGILLESVDILIEKHDLLLAELQKSPSKHTPKKIVREYIIDAEEDDIPHDMTHEQTPLSRGVAADHSHEILTKPTEQTHNATSAEHTHKKSQKNKSTSKEHMKKFHTKQ